MVNLTESASRPQSTEKLAILGGSPVRQSMLPYGKQTVDDLDRKAVDEVLRSDWLTTGPQVGKFEDCLTVFTGAKHGVAVSTGTSALHSAIHALGIGAEDEVIVPAISFVATANCVLYSGAKPVFADLQMATLNVDPDDLVRKISPRTKAIIAVDFAGHPCEHDAIREIADKHNLSVISDAAHSLGGSYKGRKVGTLQDLTALSFHPVKHITTGEGGMILTNSDALDRKLRSFRHHGIDLDLHKRNSGQTWEYDVVTLGYNYRIPDINCALGTAQMQKLPSWLKRRQEIASAYTDAFADLDILETPLVKEGCSSAWHLYVVRLNLERLSIGRKDFFSALRAENIGVNVHYIPIPWMTHYQNLGFRRGMWPVAESEYERIISLPIFPAMSDADIHDVISAVKKVGNAYRKPYSR